MKRAASVFCVLGLAACTVNGKPALDLAGLRSSPPPGPRAGNPQQSPPVATTSSTPVLSPASAAPAAPAPSVPVSYAWCAGATPDTPDATRALTDDDPDISLPELVTALCHPDDKARAQRAALEARRQGWMKQLGMTEADWARDVVEWASVRYSERNTARVEPKRDRAWSTLDPIDRFALLAVDTGPSDDVALTVGPIYLADALAPSHAGRLATITRCIHTSWDDEVHPVRWATCQPDIDAFSVAGLAAELRADREHTAYERMIVRVALAKLLPRLAAHATKVKQLVARDPAYAKLFAIARDTHAAWQRATPAREPLLALVGALDDARVTKSRKAYTGCSARAWPAFAAAVAQLGPAAFDGLHGEPGTSFLAQTIAKVVQTPDGYLAANALVACEGPHDYLLRTLAETVEMWPGARGPRTATQTAIFLAALEPDRADEKIVVSHGRRPIGARFAGDWQNPHGGSARGVIAKVTDRGDAVEISFSKQSKLQERCTSSRKTNRISRIDLNGNVFYDTVCTGWVKERIDTTPKPLTIAKRYAGAVRPGVFAVVSGGVIEGVWARPTAPRPLAAFGVALK
jgi:hypothetical protein